MSRKPPAESALFVRLPAAAVDKLDRAVEVLGVRKKDLVANLLERYLDPYSRSSGLGSLSSRIVDPADQGPKLGSYAFRAYDPIEVMNVEQASEFLQTEAAIVIELAECGKLPARKLGDAWRFSRAALLAWLAAPERR